MSRSRVNSELRNLVALDAGDRCGYCLMPQSLLPYPLFLDHIHPISKNGKTQRDNLWLSCWNCNTFKSDRIQAVDPKSGRLAKLFNPRQQTWNEHFRWDDAGVHILGLTATGRATVLTLNLNHELQVAHRIAWAQIGKFPPS